METLASLPFWVGRGVKSNDKWWPFLFCSSMNSFNRDKNIVFEEFDLRSVVVSQEQWMSLIGFNN